MASFSVSAKRRCVSSTRNQNCLLIEDSTNDELPHHLTATLDVLGNQRLNKTDILAALIYTLALESGFIPVLETTAPEFQCSTSWAYSFHVNLVEYFAGIALPPKIDDCSYQFILKLHDFSDRVCILVARELGDALCVSFSFDTKPGVSVFLPASRYILHTKLYGRSFARCITNTKNLACKLRDTLFVPIRNQIQSELGMSFFGFIGIPNEIRQEIMSYLNCNDLKRLSCSCKLLQQEVKEYLEHTLMRQQ